MIHLVQDFTLGPLGIRAHCRLGYTRLSPQGLNLVARTELEYLPTTREPLLQNIHVFAIDFFISLYILSQSVAFCKQKIKLFRLVIFLPLLTEEFVGHIGIYLGGGNGRVAQHHLYRSQVSAIVK